MLNKFPVVKEVCSIIEKNIPEVGMRGLILCFNLDPRSNAYSYC